METGLREGMFSVLTRNAEALKILVDGLVPSMCEFGSIIVPLKGESLAMSKGKGNGKGSKTKIGRDAGTGRFIPVEEAKRRPKTTVVETIRKSPPKKGK